MKRIKVEICSVFSAPRSKQLWERVKNVLCHQHNTSGMQDDDDCDEDYYYCDADDDCDGDDDDDFICWYDDCDFMSFVHGSVPMCSPTPMFLTRFNKIATQGAPQIAVDKKANSLSRVYYYYSKFNLCLFYVKPALARYLSILFLNILTLLACTQSVDNLLHTLMVLWESIF